ncbi:hypothetical protein BGX31_010580 [Mortierella sp. GBA43]|nr:hypothetical protein BGX31_010580 [Mortierella sp. GBA43]
MSHGGTNGGPSTQSQHPPKASYANVVRNRAPGIRAHPLHTKKCEITFRHESIPAQMNLHVRSSTKQSLIINLPRKDIDPLVVLRTLLSDAGPLHFTYEDFVETFGTYGEILQINQYYSMLDNVKLLTGQGFIFYRPKHPVPEALRMADGGYIRTKTAPINLKRTSKKRQKKESSKEPTTEERETEGGPEEAGALDTPTPAETHSIDEGADIFFPAETHITNDGTDILEPQEIPLVENWDMEVDTRDLVQYILARPRFLKKDCSANKENSVSDYRAKENLVPNYREEQQAQTTETMVTAHVPEILTNQDQGLDSQPFGTTEPAVNPNATNTALPGDL